VENFDWKSQMAITQKKKKTTHTQKPDTKKKKKKHTTKQKKNQTKKKKKHPHAPPNTKLNFKSYWKHHSKEGGRYLLAKSGGNKVTRRGGMGSHEESRNSRPEGEGTIGGKFRPWRRRTNS